MVARSHRQTFGHRLFALKADLTAQGLVDRESPTTPAMYHGYPAEVLLRSHRQLATLRAELRDWSDDMDAYQPDPYSFTAGDIMDRITHLLGENDLNSEGGTHDQSQTHARRV